MMNRRFIQCDVFAPIPTLGIALAVVVDGQGISDSAMARIAVGGQCHVLVEGQVRP